LTQQRTEDVVGNVDKYVETASAFHQLIAEASGSPVLSLFARSLGDMTARLARLGVYQPSEHKRVHRAHLDIGEAILAGNAELAEKLASEHMQDMRDTHRQRYPAICDNLLPYII
jgi:DNA-binding GntR family transcriptional regulator